MGAVKRQIIGVVLATLAVYMWGFLYWGASTIPYSAWQATNDDAAAGKALLEHFPVSGTYYVPGMYVDEATRNELSEAGPVAFADRADSTRDPCSRPGKSERCLPHEPQTP